MGATIASLVAPNLNVAHTDLTFGLRPKESTKANPNWFEHGSKLVATNPDLLGAN